MSPLFNPDDVTIVVPTYNRGVAVRDMLTRLVALPIQPRQIIVVDQTIEHPADIAQTLQRWSDEGKIRWLRLDRPSIPNAMNAGAQAAATPLVLFLDDDVVPNENLLPRHLAAYDNDQVWAVVGQFLEPGAVPTPTPPTRRNEQGIKDLGLAFNHDRAEFVENFFGGNLSVRRERFLQLGGFDMNFIGVAYRFETDMARRVIAAGGRIWFEPAASIAHLRIPSGGTRAYGDHKTSTSPMHSVGDYYFALHHARSFWPYAATRLRKNVLTRFHLRHPWTIPGKLVGELRGMLLARRLHQKGRLLLTASGNSGERPLLPAIDRP